MVRHRRSTAEVEEKIIFYLKKGPQTARTLQCWVNRKDVRKILNRMIWQGRVTKFAEKWPFRNVYFLPTGPIPSALKVTVTRWKLRDDNNHWNQR